MPLLRSKSWAKTNRDRRSKLLNEVCRELLYTVSTSPNGKMPYGEVAKVVKNLKNDNPWINRNVINFAFKKYVKQKKEEEGKVVASGAPVVDTDTTSSGTTKTVSTATVSTKVVAIGRPSNLKKQHEREVVTAAKNEITHDYLATKNEYKQKGEKLPDGWLKKKVISVCTKRGIPEYAPKISLSTIQSQRKAIVLQDGGSKTLMAPEEPHLVGLICAMASI